MDPLSPAVQETTSQDAARSGGGRRQCRSPSVQERVYYDLLEMINEGTLPPGARVSVRELTERLCASPTPIRLAISRLKEIGLVITVPRRGARIASVSVDEVKELYAVRRITEVPAARLAASNISQNELLVLENIWFGFRELLKNGSLREVYEADRNFLNTLFSSSGNKCLTDLIERANDRLQRYKLLWIQYALETPSSPAARTLFSYKPSLIKACKNKAPNCAEEIVLNFLHEAESQLLSKLSKKSFNNAVSI